MSLKHQYFFLLRRTTPWTNFMIVFYPDWWGSRAYFSRLIRSHLTRCIELASNLWCDWDGRLLFLFINSSFVNSLANCVYKACGDKQQASYSPSSFHCCTVHRVESDLFVTSPVSDARWLAFGVSEVFADSIFCWILLHRRSELLEKFVESFLHGSLKPAVIADAVRQPAISDTTVKVWACCAVLFLWGCTTDFLERNPLAVTCIWRLIIAMSNALDYLGIMSFRMKGEGIWWLKNSMQLRIILGAR